MPLREAVSFFDAPPGVAAARATLRFAENTNNGPGITSRSELWFGDLEIASLGIPERRPHDELVTLVMPLENQEPCPRLVSRQAGNRIQAELDHPDGTRDQITVDPDGAVQVNRSGAGEPMVIDLRKGPVALSLRTNSADSQQTLKKGLTKLAETFRTERDLPLLSGRKNLALEAEVTATGVRDSRFAARNVMDNQTWEIPIDGVLDYTLGEIETPGNGGYGQSEGPSYTENLSTWPLFLRPTYWLLPPRQTGAITLKLKQPASVRLVRLLNTTNAGLNDFATIDFEVQLLDEAEKVVARQKGSFGRVWDGAFRSAFAVPKFFSRYGRAFSGLNERGIKVPFGSGWQEIVFNDPAAVRYIRIKVLSYWAMGGGLNEVQVYR